MYIFRQHHRTACLLALVAFLACALVGCQTKPASTDAEPLPYYSEANFTPHWYDSPEAVPTDFHAIPDFSLTDQRGKTVTQEDVAGKLYIANFFFTACPGICPMTMGNMARLQKTFADNDDIVLLSHSVTPDKDSVSVLNAFAEKTHALAAKWYLVTGEREQIYNLGKYSYFADEDLGESTRAMQTRDQAFLHTESFFLIDQNRRIRGVYNGMKTASVTQLIADVHTLQQESRSRTHLTTASL